MLILLVLAIVLSPCARANLNSTLADFETHEVVPDVATQIPKELAKVIYDSGVRAATGNELTPTQVKNQPSVEWSAESDALYTLMFVDPDAPSRAEPKFRSFKHWLVANIPGADVARGDVLTAYIGSGPPQGTGLHRYVFLIYKQNGKIDISKETPVANNSRRNRPKFNAVEFVEQHGLGVPVAGNFYQAQYDDYVPLLHKQLSEN